MERADDTVPKSRLLKKLFGEGNICNIGGSS
jgi:hypothetical protein